MIPTVLTRMISVFQISYLVASVVPSIRRKYFYLLLSFCIISFSISLHCPLHWMSRKKKKKCKIVSIKELEPSDDKVTGTTPWKFLTTHWKVTFFIWFWTLSKKETKRESAAFQEFLFLRKKNSLTNLFCKSLKPVMACFEPNGLFERITTSIISSKDSCSFFW